ncbi:hypothetical protein [Nocardia sp. NPDC004123]
MLILQTATQIPLALAELLRACKLVNSALHDLRTEPSRRAMTGELMTTSSGSGTSQEGGDAECCRDISDFDGISTPAARYLGPILETRHRTLKRLLTEPELEKAALKEIAKDARMDVMPALVRGNRLLGLGTPLARDFARVP